jgi:hypothetical protein
MAILSSTALAIGALAAAGATVYATEKQSKIAKQQAQLQTEQLAIEQQAIDANTAIAEENARIQAQALAAQQAAAAEARAAAAANTAASAVSAESAAARERTAAQVRETEKQASEQMGQTAEATTRDDMSSVGRRRRVRAAFNAGTGVSGGAGSIRL